ncbi:epithelial sodium channel subunit alpha-like [Saccoglossus kowalevskii]
MRETTHNEEHKSVKTTVDNFMATTSAHGLPRIFDRRGLVITIFWTLIFATALTVSAWQIQNLIRQFVDRDINVRVEIVTAPGLKFPSVSVCNTNKLRKSAIADSPHKEMLAVDTAIVRPYYATRCFKRDFRCLNTGCIKPYLVCDGYDNCRDRSDEKNCNYGGRCVFYCDDGECIPQAYVCDGHDDCSEGEDEADCESVVTTTEEPEHVPDLRPVYKPTVEYLSGEYSDISNDVSIYTDFINSYYHDHLLGRVVSEDPPDWFGFISHSTTPDYSDLESVLKLTASEVTEYGHQLKDFILQCSFDSQECNMTRDFRHFVDDKYGNCYQFNPMDPNREIFYATKTGARYGLKMTLFTEQKEYISVYGRDSGARVVIHPPHTPPIPWSEGITITPGKVTSLGIKEVRIAREPEPYGNCTREYEYNSIYGDYYDKKACEETCIQDTMMKHCGCVDTMLRNKFPRCKLLDRTQDICKQMIYYFALKQALNCECKQPCNESWYEFSASHSLWPSDIYLKHLLTQIHYDNPKTKGIQDFETASKNLVRLDVYFEALNYESITERPAITEQNLLSDIGGTLGLYCGFSFITIVEFIQLAVDLTRAGIRR